MLPFHQKYTPTNESFFNLHTACIEEIVWRGVQLFNLFSVKRMILSLEMIVFGLIWGILCNTLWYIYQ